MQYQYLSFSRLRPKPHSLLLIFLLACATGSADRKHFAWSGRLIRNCLVLKEDNPIVILPLTTSSFTCSHKFQGDTALNLCHHFPPSSSKIHCSHKCNQRGAELLNCFFNSTFGFEFCWYTRYQPVPVVWIACRRHTCKCPGVS